MIPSVTCLRLSDASVICRVTCFQCPIQSAFLSCRKPGSCSGVRGMATIGHRTLPKMWKVRSLYATYSPRERLWIDSNGFPVPTRVVNTNSISIASEVFAGSLGDRPTDHASWSFAIGGIYLRLSLIHIWRCRRSTLCRSRWSPYH